MRLLDEPRDGPGTHHRGVTRFAGTSISPRREEPREVEVQPVHRRQLLPTAAILVGFLLAPRVAAADFANNEAIHAHVDTLVGRLDVAKLDADQRRSLRADRLTLSLGILIPIYGSYELDHKVFGELRPAAVVFDWILGGIVPAGLGVIALASGNSLSSRTRAILGWSAVGLYASTRIGILIIANLHVSEYNRYLQLRLGAATTPGGQVAPALVMSTVW